MTQTTPNHTQSVAGWAALEQNGKITPYVFKRRCVFMFLFLFLFFGDVFHGVESES